MVRLVLLLPLVVFAQSWPATADALSPRFDPETMMPTTEIQRGMMAVGKSVFEGVRITEFDMKILAVLEKADLGKDLIIARILNGPVVERECGVMGGMSGSPVYINGRLIGAIAYTWYYEREPIAGITSIDAMLQCLDQPELQEACSPFSKTVERYCSLRGPFEVNGRRFTRVKIVPAGEQHPWVQGATTMVMERVAPPIYCSGLPEAAMEHLGRLFKPRGMEPVAGPGIMRNPVDTELVPGAAFGLLLASGDFDISTGGTITYRDGNLVLGFGHPFMELGRVDVPLTTSWVHDFVPCYHRTDKLMSPMKEVGALTQDRSWSVGGRLGVRASFVPATFTITDQTRGKTETYQVKVMKQRQITGSLLASCAMAAVASTYNSPGEGMVRVKMTVKGDKGDRIRREDVYYHAGDLYFPAVDNLSQAVSLLTENRFRPQDIASLEYEASFSDADNTAAIEDLAVDQPVAKAGEDITVRVRLRPDNGDVVERVVTLPIPVDVPQGRLRIGVCNGLEARQMRSRLGILLPTFYSLEDAIRDFESQWQADQLYVVAAIPGAEVSLLGAKIGAVPPFIGDVLRRPNRTDVVAGGGEVSRTVDVPWVLYGAIVITLPAEDRQGRKGSPKPSGGSAGRDGTEETSLAGGRLLPSGVPESLWWAASAFTVPRPPHTNASPAVRHFGLGALATNSEGGDTPETDAGVDDDQTDSEAETDEGDSAGGEKKSENEGKVARRLSIWTQSSEADFAAGKAKGLAISSDGHVRLIANWSEPIPFQEAHVWCLAPGTDAVFAGTVGPGRIYRLVGGECTLLHDTGTLGVTALTVGEDGSVLAATLPEGRILRISPAGDVQEICRIGAPIWDMIPNPAGGWWVAAGPGATVYRVSAEGVVSKHLSLRHGHVTRLLQRGEDLYVATASNGAVYHVTATGLMEAIYDAGGADVSALVAGEDASLLAATAPRGQVVRLRPHGSPEILYEASDRGVLTLLPLLGHTLAGTSHEGVILHITDRDTRTTLHEDDGSQVLDLCAAGPRVYAACSNPAAVLFADLEAPAKGTLESAVFDAGRRAEWGRVDWQASIPEGCRLSLRFRSGNSSDPKDESWSQWSPPLTQPGRDRPGVPPARYLQYRLEMARDSGAGVADLDWIRVSYLPSNRRPTLNNAKPAEGDAIRGKRKLEWKMEDPDGDTLQARVMIRRRGKADFETIKEELLKGEWEWDTKLVEDGVYDIRIVVDDSLSNPTDFEETYLDIANVTVDNTPPEIQIISGPTRQDDGTFLFSGLALDATCPITSIAWRVSGSDAWRAVRLDDGLADSRYERFLVVTAALKEDVKQIILRAYDAAGNSADKAVDLPNTESQPK